MKKLLYFGIYDRKYARTQVIQNGFSRNGWEVIECRVDPKEVKGLAKYLQLFRLGLDARKQKYDLVIVGFPGQSVVWLARLLFGKDIVFDAFLSLYDSNVSDRKLYAENSWRAKKDRFLDIWSCRLSRNVLLDTNGNIDYFVRRFGLPREKFIRVFIGADDTIFSQLDVPEEKEFTAHFHGTFIPLQGIRHIVDAAHIVRDKGIHFRIVGHGQDAKDIDAHIRELNLEEVITRVPKVPVSEIPGIMGTAHVVFGIFGDSDKALKAIPNKVFEAMAMGKCIVTADTPGIRELTDAHKIFSLVPAADPKALAQALLDLKSDDTRRRTLGYNARAAFERILLPESIVAELLRTLQKV